MVTCVRVPPASGSRSISTRPTPNGRNLTSRTKRRFGIAAITFDVSSIVAGPPPTVW